MNYALVLLALGIIVKFVYENVSDCVYVKLGRPLKTLFLALVMASAGCGAVSIVFNFAQPISASSNDVSVSVYEQQITELQTQLDECVKQLASVEAELAEVRIERLYQEVKYTGEATEASVTSGDNEKESANKSESTNKTESTNKSESKSKKTKTVRVIADVNFRAGASRNSKVYTVLRQGTELQVLNSNGAWLKVEYNGVTGYVSKRFCEDL